MSSAVQITAQQMSPEVTEDRAQFRSSWQEHQRHLVFKLACAGVPDANIARYLKMSRKSLRVARFGRQRKKYIHGKSRYINASPERLASSPPQDRVPTPQPDGVQKRKPENPFRRTFLSVPPKSGRKDDTAVIACFDINSFGEADFEKMAA